MIFPDTVTVSLRARHEVPGGGYDYTWTDYQVPGLVTFLDSSTTFDTASNITRSRLKIVLSPFAVEIPANSGQSVMFAWGPYNSLSPDGAVERHVLRGRLHHYEVIAKAV
jgi:hypothetical protein